MLKKLLYSILIGFLALAISVVLILLFVPLSPGEYPTRLDAEVIRVYELKNELQRVDELHEYLPDNKTLPPKFGAQALLALSHYPQLEDVQVEFVVKESLTPLHCRPVPLTLLGPKKNRIYRVTISSKGLDAMEGILLKNLPFNAQVGILGHELGHAVYYEGLSTLQIIKYALCYFNPKFRGKNEKGTDIAAIKNGLGWQLYDYAEYVRTYPGSNYEESQWVDNYYLHQDSILEVMQSLPMYQQPNE